MNNLHRELAPISDGAWAEIEEEAIADAEAVPGRRGEWWMSWARRAPRSPRSAPATRAPSRPPARAFWPASASVKALVELRVPFVLDRQADRRRGARLATIPIGSR